MSNKRDPIQYIIDLRPDLKIIGNYSGWRNKIEVECIKCGHKWSPAYSSVCAGHGCPSCARQVPPTKEEFRKRVIETNPYIDLLEDYKGNCKTKVSCKCKICGYVWETLPQYLYKKHPGCPICTSWCIADGFNSFADKRPNLAAMLKNIDDASGVGVCSSKRMTFICPECGEEVVSTPLQVTQRGLPCPRCYDGISYPNKFMYSILSQMDICFIPEKTFKWSKNRRYDFYIPSTNTIIEVHGLQHYEGTRDKRRRSLEQEIENDKLKYNLATSNGISFYIVIDARYSDCDYMASSISNSKLSAYANFSRVDFSLCEKFASTSMVAKCADLWNKGYSIKEVAHSLGLSVATIYKYIKHINASGLSTRKLNGKKLHREKLTKLQSAKVICTTTGIVYDSMTIAAKETGSYQANISRCCMGRRSHAGTDLITQLPLKWEYYKLETTQHESNN